MFGRCFQKAVTGGQEPATEMSGSPWAFLGKSRKSAGPSLAGALGALAILGALLAMGTGCSTSREAGGPTEAQAEAFGSTIRPASGDTSRLMRNAHYYQLMGRPELALKELEEAHVQEPDNLKIVNSLAQRYEELGDYQRAQKLYQEALDRHGPNAALTNNLCYSYYLAGNWAQAEACFKQALALDPGNQMARNNLGLLYCRQGKREEALRLWREVVGEALAQEKVNQTMAALGTKAPAAPARPPMAAPEKRVPAVTAAKTRQPEQAPPVQPALAAKEKVEKRLEVTTKPVGAPQAETPRLAAVAPAPAPAPPKKPEAAPPEKTKAAEVAKPVAPGEKVASLVAVSAKPEGAPQAETPRPAAAAPAPPPPVTAKKPPAATPEKAKPAVVAKPVAAAPSPPPVLLRPLTAKELAETAVEVRNGTPTPNLAHQTRSALSLEGFNVADIGNHIDWGAEITVIYYRPEAERVAQALAAKFFPIAKLEKSQKLKDGIDVKILLGHDLVKNRALMTRLTGGEED